jgi:uracil phosphoribosyltransferase
VTHIVDRDEMDMMKEKLANAAQVEEKFAHLQDKLKEMAELRKQYKALQEQSNTYMQRSIELEDEVVKIPLLKAQIEDYKKQGRSCLSHGLFSAKLLDNVLTRWFLSSAHVQVRGGDDRREGY